MDAKPTTSVTVTGVTLNLTVHEATVLANKLDITCHDSYSSDVYTILRDIRSGLCGALVYGHSDEEIIESSSAIMDALRNGQSIKAIREFRHVTGRGPRQARNAIDQYQASHPQDASDEALAALRQKLTGF